MRNIINTIRTTSIAKAAPETTFSANVFDLTDLSDLPEDLRKPLETEGRNNAVKYAELVKAAYAAGFKQVNIREVIVFAHRAFGSTPTATTVRNYLNAAIALGLIGKPTRNTYSADTSVVVEGDDEAAEEQQPEADPLAAVN